MSIATFNSEILPKSDFSVLVSTDLKSFGHWYPSITQSLSAIRPMHRSTSKLTSLDHSPYVPNTNASILPKDSKCSSHALVQNDGVATTAGMLVLLVLLQLFFQIHPLFLGPLVWPRWHFLLQWRVLYCILCRYLSIS